MRRLLLSGSSLTFINDELETFNDGSLRLSTAGMGDSESQCRASSTDLSVCYCEKEHCEWTRNSQQPSKSYVVGGRL